MKTRSYRSEYGTTILGHGGFEGRRRVDLYIPHDGSRPEVSRPFALDATDDSPSVSTYAHQLGHTGEHVRRYNSECPSCYLGHPHTAKLHDARVTAAMSRQKG